MAVSDIIDVLEERAQQTGDKSALVWEPFEGDSRSWTYRELLDEVQRLAAQLSSRGVAAGDRVILHSDNSPEFVLAWFACAWLGAVCVVTNPKSAGPELAYFAEHTGAAGAITQPSYVAMVSSHCGSLRWVCSAADGSFGFSGDQSDAASDSIGRGATHRLTRPVMDARQPGSMMFTSGTTSRAKAVVWSRANALWAGRSGARNASLTADDVLMVFVPLYHVVGMAWSLLPAVVAGATVVLQPRFSASRFWEVAQRRRATFASHVQFSSGVLARMPAPEAHHFRLWGNSTWLPEYERHFHVPIMGWWGMTELVAPGIVGDAIGNQQPGSIGRPAPGYEVRIVDEEGQPVAAGESGELLLRGMRGETIFSEYYANPEATAAAFTDDGWFRTGDRMLLHADGSLQFIERARDVIKVGGEGVSPAEVERVIREVDGVLDAAVVGRPDAVYGEVGVAFVVVPEDMAATESQLEAAVRARCEAQLAPFKVPREIRFLRELPRAGLNKIAKGRLREMALSPAAPGADPSCHG